MKTNEIMAGFFNLIKDCKLLIEINIYQRNNLDDVK